MLPVTGALAALALVLSRANSSPADATLIPRGGYIGSGFYNGAYTYGLPATCGGTPTDTDLIVAVTRSVFDSFPGTSANLNESPACGKKIVAKHDGKTANLTVTDLCATFEYLDGNENKYLCRPGGDFEMTKAAFNQLVGRDPKDYGLDIVEGIEWDWA
ncbi:hypothetical protein MKEN_00206600 [Mycena kentingensis (nom. inval.)]|nr:hypothetical protein MKEN_00206600 [Mycena kentingensis (nom. inval.)]